MAPKVSSLKDASSNIAIRADRTVAQLDSLNIELASTSAQLLQLQQDATDLIGISRWVIEKIVDLKNSFENAAPVENREQLLLDAERLVLQIRQNENRFF